MSRHAVEMQGDDAPEIYDAFEALWDQTAAWLAQNDGGRWAAREPADRLLSVVETMAANVGRMGVARLAAATVTPLRQLTVRERIAERLSRTEHVASTLAAAAGSVAGDVEPAARHALALEAGKALAVGIKQGGDLWDANPQHRRIQ